MEQQYIYPKQRMIVKVVILKKESKAGENIKLSVNTELAEENI